MDTWVVNLDSQPERWATIQNHLEGFGIVPNRWPATPDDHRVRLWTDLPRPDQTRRRAIVNTYQRLLAHLKDTDSDRWLILQDDVRALSTPVRDNPGPLHIYGGWRVKPLLQGLDGIWRTSGDPYLSKSHVCPQAFALHRTLLAELASVWGDETRQVCTSWQPLVDRFATFDVQPTIEPGITDV